MLKSKWLLLVCLLFILNDSYAQNSDKKWSIGVLGGKTEYIGDVGFSPFDFNQPFFWNVGLKATRYIDPSFNVALSGSFGDHGYFAFRNHRHSFLTDMFQANATLEYKFANGYIIPEDFILNPYVFAGIGLTWHEHVNRIEGFVDMTIPLGIGLDVRINDTWSAFWQSTFAFTTGDRVDLKTGPANRYTELGTDAFMLHQIGVKFNFGKAKDTDGDGISDRQDKCPEIAGLEAFEGCPDTDGDGLQDSEDDCPQTRGLTEFKGCPDTDGDGVMDKEDGCPEVAGLKEFKGCPDSDADGVQDSEDECPEVKGEKDLKGCPDGDADGVADKDDKCPDVKGLATFAGCPDTDGDGVQDSEDDCPDKVGTVADKGCPDTDGDGLADNKDECPTEKGIAILKGCPDGDGDGVADKDDKCPTKQGLIGNEGCPAPDNDGDGVPDSKDKCPNKKGPIALEGCPDTDQDGIPDDKDKCPETAGIAANDGCPEVKAEVKKIFEEALQGIQFNTGRSSIKDESLNILDKVATIMAEYDNANLTIEGYTDSQGSASTNKRLSQSRADAVLKYLTTKGVAKTRMSAKGFGEASPVADNKTAEGREKNRRVEFNLKFD